MPKIEKGLERAREILANGRVWNVGIMEQWKVML